MALLEVFTQSAQKSEDRQINKLYKASQQLQGKDS